MRITRVDCHVLLDPAFDPDLSSSAQDDIVVEVHTDEGIVGIGETDLNAWVARACIEAPGTHTMDRGLGASLLGLDPLDPPAVWRRLYQATAMTGRRGALVNALGAIDMALWDICGKAHGVPVWRLLGEARETPVQPYASLQPDTESFEAYLESIVDWVGRAQRLGFRAAKLETCFSGPYAHAGLREPDERMTEVIAAARRRVGREFTLMVDVQYAFDSVERALRMLERWAEYDLYFVETPLWVDDLEGHAELARRAPVRIASGEWLATRHEFAELIERGGVAVVQPDVGRVGGLTEALAVAQLAGRREREVVPHAWKTGISIAAAAHLAAVTPHVPFLEFLPQELSGSPLRRELVRDEVRLEDGRLSLPEQPGLGVKLERDALERFADAAQRLETRRG